MDGRLYRDNYGCSSLITNVREGSRSGVGNPALRLVLRFTVWRGFHLLARDIAVASPTVASPTGAPEKPFRNIPGSGKK
jgi:hypothetical protein